MRNFCMPLVFCLESELLLALLDLESLYYVNCAFGFRRMYTDSSEERCSTYVPKFILGYTYYLYV